MLSLTKQNGIQLHATFDGLGGQIGRVGRETFPLNQASAGSSSLHIFDRL